MGNNSIVKGWMAYQTADEKSEHRKYFLDVSNAVTYCEQQRVSMSIQPQYFRRKHAEDLHKSRRRQAARER